MSDGLEHARYYRATAEDLEKRAQKSSVKDEFLLIARLYRRLADDLEANLTFSKPLSGQSAGRN